MQVDNLDEVLKDVLHQQVREESFCLEGLEERIVTEMAGRLPKAGPFDLFKRLLAPTHGARLAQLAVITATAAIFLVVGIFLGDRLPQFHPLPGSPGTETAAGRGESEVLFVMPAPGAHSVTVVGNFNDWEATPLSDENGDGIWTASIPLPPGRYEYAFVVDGRWWGQDPLADEYVRSFGEYNSVRYVGQVGDGA
jgi:hypothetical protein